MGSSQNLRAVSGAEAGAGPESERRLGVHATLVSLLEMAYGSRPAAVGALERALAAAGCDSLPEGAADLLAFARGSLLHVLCADIGPSLTTALVEDFTARLDLNERTPTPSSAPPSTLRPVARVSLRSRSTPAPAPHRSVLLVDADRVGRAALARALMRARWGVRAVESSEELAEALGDGPPPDATVVDLQHPGAAGILRAILSVAPAVFVVVRGSETGARALLDEAGARCSDVRPREAPAEDLIEVLRYALEG